MSTVEIQSQNYLSTQSSCYTLDIRNSTTIIRRITYGGEGANKDKKRLQVHAEFMMGIHAFVFEKLKKMDVTEFYFDNTGDGHMCVFWNKTHAWTLLDVVCSLSIYLDKELEKYKSEYLDVWAKQIKKELNIGYGIGIHTARSVIYQHKLAGRQFGYGTVLNSSKRVESYTKNFNNQNLLFTGNFIEMLSTQFKFMEADRQRRLDVYEDKIKKVTNVRCELNDGKADGHFLYTITKSNRAYFSTK